MTDELPPFDSLDLRLSKLAGELAAPRFNAGSGGIGNRVWPFFRQAADQLIQQGEDPARVEYFVEVSRERFGILPDGFEAPLPSELHDTIAADFAARVAEEQDRAEGLQRLDEKWIKEITEFRIVIFHNESKHRGFPHVKVSLPAGDINISIGPQPEVVAGRRGLPGEAAALECVKTYRKLLQKRWNETRPDDQKLEKKPLMQKPTAVPPRRGKRRR